MNKLNIDLSFCAPNISYQLKNYGVLAGVNYLQKVDAIQRAVNELLMEGMLDDAETEQLWCRTADRLVGMYLKDWKVDEVVIKPSSITLSLTADKKEVSS